MNLKLLQKRLEQIRKKIMELRRQQVYDRALGYLGTDVTPADLIDDVVACAETISTILQPLTGMPVIPGTAKLLEYLASSGKFTEVYDPQPGDVCVAATGTGNGKRRGHTWIVGKNGLMMSNSSLTGKFGAYHTIDTARELYEKQGGMKLRFFALT